MPELGRWTSPDPARVLVFDDPLRYHRLAHNPYVFAANNPAAASDPLGLLPIGAWVAIGVGAVAVAGVALWAYTVHGLYQLASSTRNIIRDLIPGSDSGSTSSSPTLTAPARPPPPAAVPPPPPAEHLLAPTDPRDADELMRELENLEPALPPMPGPEPGGSSRA
jgi:hypothetical protein